MMILNDCFNVCKRKRHFKLDTVIKKCRLHTIFFNKMLTKTLGFSDQKYNNDNNNNKGIFEEICQL